MNKEIKEIYLGELKWTKTHDNMGGVIGNFIFKDNVSYEDYQKLFKNIYFVLCNKDYITKLQRYVDDTFLYTYEELQDKVIALQFKVREKQEKINKAIEYIEKENNEKFYNQTIVFALDRRKEKLLSILKGSEE